MNLPSFPYVSALAGVFSTAAAAAAAAAAAVSLEPTLRAEAEKGAGPSDLMRRIAERFASSPLGVGAPASNRAARIGSSVLEHQNVLAGRRA